MPEKGDPVESFTCFTQYDVDTYRQYGHLEDAEAREKFSSTARYFWYVSSGFNANRYNSAWHVEKNGEWYFTDPTDRAFGGYVLGRTSCD